MATVIYEFELPDGTIVEAEGPDGMSQEQAQAMAMKNPQVVQAMQAAQGQPQVDPRSFEEQELAMFGQSTPEEDKLMAQGAGSLIGTALSGFNPAGGAAGFAIGDLLYDKFANDKSFGWQDAGMSFGEGALYELLPTLGLKGLQKMVPKDLPKRMMRRAMSVPPKTKQDIADRMAQFALDQKLPMTRAGLAKASAIAAENAEKVTARVAELQRQGKKIKLTQVIDDLKKELKDPFKHVRGEISEGKLASADKYADSLYLSYGKTFKTPAGIPDDIPIEEALLEKRAIDKNLSSEFINMRKMGQSEFTGGENKKLLAQANALRNGINADKVIAGYNKDASQMYEWAENALGQLMKGETSNLISSQIYMPALLETMYKGGPGIATALGITRAGVNNPTMMSHGAILLNEFKKLQGAPPMYKQLYIKELLDEFMEGNFVSRYNESEIEDD